MTEARKHRSWRRRLALLAAACIALAVVLAGAAAWIASSEAALAWAIERAVAASGGRLSVEGVRGTLLTPVTAERILYADPSVRIEARAVRLEWSPIHLLRERLALGRLEAGHVAVRLAARGDAGAPGAPAALPADLAPPIALRLRRARFGTIELAAGADGGADPGETRIVLHGVRFDYDGDARAHRVGGLALEFEAGTERGSLRADAEVGARRPYPLAVAVELAQPPARSARAKLAGTLERTTLDAAATIDGVPLTATAVVRPFAPRWLEALDARAQAVNLAELASGAPRTAVDARLALRSDTERTLAGTVEATNAAAGPLDRGVVPVQSLAAELTTDLRTARLAPLTIALAGGGRLAGSGELAADGVRLALDAQALSLRALQSTLIETALAGRIEATLGPDGQSLRARLAQAPISIAADVRRTGDELRFTDVRAAAKRGELRASGRLRLDGAMPLVAEARFARFDPAEWGDYPAATLNGDLDVQAGLAARTGTLRFALADSSLRGVPLSGRGAIEAAAHGAAPRIASAQADLVLGANRASARGAFGAPGDELRLALAAPRAAELDPRLRGRIDAQARVMGGWEAPRVAFTASAVDLGIGRRIALGALGASGELGWFSGAPLEIDATAANAAAGGIEAERLELHARGTREQHAVDLRATGAQLDLALRVVGGWRAERGWSGSIAGFESGFGDGGAGRIALDGSVPLELGPGRVHVGAFAARVGGGRLAAGETHWVPGNLTTSGEFSGLPVSPLLAFAGLDDAVSATLTLSGGWQLAATPRLNGRIRLARDAGDLLFRTDPAVPLGLGALRLDAELVEERATGTLVARGTGLELRAEARATPVGDGADAGLGRDSPLALEARLEAPSLKPFAALLALPASLAGRVQADVAATGTIGAPAWRGTLEARDVVIQSPPYGIDWQDGRLRVELAGRAVRVTELALVAGGGRFTADGVLERSGEATAGRVRWRAERFAALNRPDRNLTVSGDGTVALDAGRLTLRGALRADSGHFEIDPRTTAALGEDVVVLGRKEKSAQRAGAPRLPLVVDFDLDLGKDLTVRGAGLDARLVGAIKVTSLPTGQIVAHGTVQTRRGVFYAYGQKLDVERGRLLFDGPIENPGLDIAAWRRNQAVEAGVEVKGPLRTPLVRVVSNPPVPESEQLAWLVLGRPAESGAQTDYAALQVAAAALLGSRGGAQQRSVAQMVGLDEIGFRADGAAGSQAVALGKRLSDRLYVTYEQSVDAALAVLRLEYALTRRFALRAETGTRSGMDVFYRYSFD